MCIWCCAVCDTTVIAAHTLLSLTANDRTRARVRRAKNGSERERERDLKWTSECKYVIIMCVPWRCMLCVYRANVDRAATFMFVVHCDVNGDFFFNVYVFVHIDKCMRSLHNNIQLHRMNGHRSNYSINDCGVGVFFLICWFCCCCRYCCCCCYYCSCYSRQ